MRLWVRSAVRPAMGMGTDSGDLSAHRVQMMGRQRARVDLVHRAQLALTDLRGMDRCAVRLC